MAENACMARAVTGQSRWRWRGRAVGGTQLADSDANEDDRTVGAAVAALAAIVRR